MRSNYNNSSSFSETNSSSSKENHLDYPYVSIIPHFVATNENLSAPAKLHFGAIAALAQKEGYCWATDEQLAQMNKVSRRQILRWHEELEREGCIQRETFNQHVRQENGSHQWVKKRRIYVAGAFRRAKNNVDRPQGNSKNVSESDKNVTFIEGDKNVTFIEGDKNVTYNKRITNRENLRERGAPDGATHTSVSFTSEKKKEPKRFVERAEHVKTTDDQHAKLIAEFGEDDVQLMYERLSLWKQNTAPSKWKPSDFITCKGWVRKAISEDKLHEERVKKTQKNSAFPQRNMEIAKKIEQLAQSSPNSTIKTYVSALNKYLEFQTGPTTQPICIDYEDRDFVNKARSATQRVRWKEAQTYLQAF